MAGLPHCGGRPHLTTALMSQTAVMPVTTVRVGFFVFQATMLVITAAPKEGLHAGQ
ncbi:MAG: hypothetical protein ACRDJV_15440 [Actinomycetota bacterium]